MATTSDAVLALEDAVAARLEDLGWRDEVTATTTASVVAKLCNRALGEVKAVQPDFDEALPSSASMSDVTRAAFRLGLVTDTDTPHQLRVLDFMLSELQVARLSCLQRGKSASGRGGADAGTAPTTTGGGRAAQQSNPVPRVQQLCRALGIPGVVTANKLPTALAKIMTAVKPLAATAAAPSTPLLAASTVSADDRALLVTINEAFRKEYRVRRQMLLQRFDVTVQALLWSEKVKEHVAEVMSDLKSQRAALTPEPATVSVDDVFAAGAEALLCHKRRVTDTNMAAGVKKIRIPQVPDRGGRADEMRPTAADYNPFRRRGRGRGGRRGGNRNKGKPQQGRQGGAAGGSGGGGGGGGTSAGGGGNSNNNNSGNSNNSGNNGSNSGGGGGGRKKRKRNKRGRVQGGWNGGGRGGRGGGRGGRGGGRGGRGGGRGGGNQGQGRRRN